MIKFKAKTIINGKVKWNKEDGEHQYYSALRGALHSIEQELITGHWDSKTNKWIRPKEGFKQKLNIVLEWECTMNRRAPARAKDVIVKEKQARAVKHAKRQAERKEAERQHKIEQQNLRDRIKKQVDHAFLIGAQQGKHGTEPAAKFITCQYCNSPAHELQLSRRLNGASVLDEDTIVGVVCKQHTGATPWWTYRYGQDSVETIKCERLEFFYDGVRQIGIKP